MRSQTAIFSKLVRDFMRAAPARAASGTRVGEAVRRMAEDKATSVLITDDAGRPLGILTEQDVARRIAFRADEDAAVEDVMTAPVLTIEADEYLYHAIGQMRRRRLRHMPVVDAEGMLVGTLDLHDALAVAADRMTSQIDRLTVVGNVEGLREVKTAQIEIAQELLDDNLPAPDVQQFLTHVNNDIYNRIVDACLTDMAKDGWGPAPVKFTVIVMGSGGRGENYLFPDQDNGFILEDYPDADHTRIDGFFIELAERMTRDLNTVGFPYCKGFCMASNPIWRKSISQWRQQIEGWARTKNFVAIRLSDIFFDFQMVWGETFLARQLRTVVLDMIRRNHFFLQMMYEEEKDHNVALGLFNRFTTEKNDSRYLGMVNLKQTGTLPMVEAIRLFSLREGIAATSTLARVDALHKKGVLDDNERSDLVRAYQRITKIMLTKQIRDFLDHNETSYYIHPGTLTRRLKRDLTDALKAIARLRQKVRMEFTGDVF